MKARSRFLDELKNAFMRNHTYATFAYLKDKDFLVFKFFELHIRGFVTFFQVRLPFVVTRFCKVI